MATQRTGAQIIWECLVHQGVNTVFGYPGGAILPAYDAMLDYPVRHVLVRHEQGRRRDRARRTWSPVSPPP
jgi:acetolactate synthase-1/2/3 large subunit